MRMQESLDNINYKKRKKTSKGKKYLQIHLIGFLAHEQSALLTASENLGTSK